MTVIPLKKLIPFVRIFEIFRESDGCIEFLCNIHVSQYVQFNLKLLESTEVIDQR